MGINAISFEYFSDPAVLSFVWHSEKTATAETEV